MWQGPNVPPFFSLSFLARDQTLPWRFELLLSLSLSA